MGRLSEFPPITADEAYAALRWFVAKDTIESRQIVEALRHRDELIWEIRERLAALDGEGLTRLSARIATRGPESAPRRRKASAKARAAWKAQGRYMAAVRRLPKAARVQVRGVREKSGVSAAIAAAKRIGSKSRRDQ